MVKFTPGPKDQTGKRSRKTGNIREEGRQTRGASEIGEYSAPERRRKRPWQERSHKRKESKQGYTTAMRREFVLETARRFKAEGRPKEDFLDFISNEALGNVEGVEHLYIRPAKL